MRINPKPILLAMLENDETRESICGKAKVSRDTLRKMENGQMVQLQSLKKLCLSLGVKPKDVLTDTAAHGPSDSIASHHSSGMFIGLKEEMLEEFVALLKETTDRETLQGIMQTIKLFRRGSR